MLPNPMAIVEVLLEFIKDLKANRSVYDVLDELEDEVAEWQRLYDQGEDIDDDDSE